MSNSLLCSVDCIKEMVRHGPCCHCGITETPLWRNGPPSKPVLCNACGYRWTKKGTLNNYTPRHLRVSTPDDYDNIDHGAKGGESSSNYEPSKTGSTQTTFWDSPIPSQKRKSHERPSPSFVDKLRNDLYDILQQEPSFQSESKEDVLIYKKEEDPNAYFETSLGSVLLKRPVQSAKKIVEGSSLDTKT